MALIAIQLVLGISAGNFHVQMITYRMSADSDYPLSQQNIFSINVNSHLQF